MRFSIRTLLTLPLLILILTPIGIVGWLFYSNSKKAVTEIAGDVFSQISDRTHDQIQLYLTTPHFINQINATSIEQGLLAVEDREKIERYFVDKFRAAYRLQLSQKSASNSFNNDFTGSINHIYIGTPEGLFSGVEYGVSDKNDPNSEDILTIVRLVDDKIQRYRVQEDGTIGEQLNSDNTQTFELKERLWYKKGENLSGQTLTKNKAGWTQPYCDQSTKSPVITAVRSVAFNNQLVGFLGSDFLFSDIEIFIHNMLEGLKIEGGIVFILNQDQQIWINSELNQHQKCDATGSGELSLTSARDLEDSIISQLVSIPGNNETLNSIIFQNQDYFWTSFKIQDDYDDDLALSVFIAIPEVSFTGNINQTLNDIIQLCFLTLIITGIFAILLARQITKPVLQLKQAAHSLVDSLHQEQSLAIEIYNPSELYYLAHAFEVMSTQLTDLFIAFRHFVPQNFLNSLGCKDATEVELGKYKRVKMTILFSDIRSFTSLSEKMTPEQNFQFINAYLKRMEPAVSENHGFIDKYIGDAIMALFEGEKSAENAVKASLNMLERLKAYNKTRTTEERPPLKIGIGIHTGEITIGTLGGLNRWDTTVIGGDVNRASRVEGLTKEFGSGLLISQQTLAVLESTYHHRYLGKASVRGLDEPVTIYEIYEADEQELLDGKIRTASLFQEALYLYEQKHYSQSLEKFRAVVSLCPQDEAAQYYIRRSQKYLGSNL